ncbi:MAG: phage virion morphogenesis protein [Solirubrobacteraceae bacterium]|nr:phage virion morphogenesis protein [Solirubrobacteraceae bacterium]
MPIRITIDALGESIVDRTLLGVENRLDDMTPVWDELDSVLSRASVRQFASQGAHGSGGWQPLAPSTLARKAAAGHDHRILHATRRLRQSLTNRDHGEHLYIGQPHQMIWGTLVPYARHHQDGDGVPRRRVIQLPESARRQAVKVMQQGILEGVGLR